MTVVVHLVQLFITKVTLGVNQVPINPLAQMKTELVLKTLDVWSP